MELVVRIGEVERQVTVVRHAERWLLTLDGRTIEIEESAARPGVSSLLIDGQQHEVAVRREAEGRYWVTSARGSGPVEVADRLTHLARSSHGGEGGAGRGEVTAYMPGRVVTLLVAVGDEVAAGQGVAVLEAMKMENEIQAERSGVVREIFVEAGQSVESGDRLLEIG